MDKKKTGRPKKYTEEVICKLASELIAYMKKDGNYWLKGFCVEKGFPSQMLSEFAKENKDFSESLKKAKDLQETKLLKLALEKPANTTFIIFALKNVAGWRNEDKSENEETTNKPIQIEIIKS